MDSVSQESNLRLIKEIKKRPCLYNKTLISYNRISVQDKAWAEVAHIMGWKVALCKERWRNLRCVYIRHVRRLSQGIHKRPYYLMNAMRFSLPFIKTLNDKSLPTEILQANSDEELEENSDGEDPQFSFHTKFLSSSPQQPNSSGSVSPKAEPPFETEILPSPVCQVKNEDISQSSDLSRSSHNSGALKEIFKTANANEVHVDISDLTPNLELQNDAKKMFLLSLLPDVYAMSDVQMRTFKRGVLNIIGNIFDSGSSSTRPTNT